MHRFASEEHKWSQPSERSETVNMHPNAEYICLPKSFFGILHTSEALGAEKTERK
jgi:hypothetical protein